MTISMHIREVTERIMDEMSPSTSSQLQVKQLWGIGVELNATFEFQRSGVDVQVIATKEVGEAKFISGCGVERNHWEGREAFHDGVIIATLVSYARLMNLRAGRHG